MVRKLLKGRFENTAFCVFAPDGKTRLSGTGRSPLNGLGVNRRPSVKSEKEAKVDNAKAIRAMNAIVKKYPAKADLSDALVSDFHSFKQSLNVSSGDQRLLVYTVGAKNELKSLKNILQKVANDEKIIGRFHYDFFSEGDQKWSEVIEGESSPTGIYVIQPGEFGQSGNVVAEFSLDSSLDAIRTSLIEANTNYAASEERKNYAEHRKKARSAGITYEDNMPWGEDRDGDGVIDERKSSRRSR